MASLVISRRRTGQSGQSGSEDRRYNLIWNSAIQDGVVGLDIAPVPKLKKRSVVKLEEWRDMYSDEIRNICMYVYDHLTNSDISGGLIVSCPNGEMDMMESLARYVYTHSENTAKSYVSMK